MGLKPVKVSQLNGYIRRILAGDPILANLSVVGEVSNFKRHSNGHVYFTLKDENARISCFLPGDVYGRMTTAVSDGMSVVATGHINVYERGGAYSLNIREMAPEGKGALAVAFDNMKEQLAAEGLFDGRWKKPLPAFPRRIGIVTSATGAAVEDMVSIITGRNQVVDILIYPTLVQGPEAAAGIAGGIEFFNEMRPEVDLMIIGRGGGSAEELWAFNEEQVARAIFDSRIPVISAVGHETDVTISDFVADVRAETPTAAAQIAAPDTGALVRQLEALHLGMGASLARRIERNRLRLERYRMDEMNALLVRKLGSREEAARSLLRELRRTMGDVITKKAWKYMAPGRELEALNPLKILERGYSVLTDLQGKTVRTVSSVAPGDPLTARFADGRVQVTVDGVEERSQE